MSVIKHATPLSVGDFFEQFKEPLQLELINGTIGFDRNISEATINRPGLALSGFYNYFADKRVQVFGDAEIEYLRLQTSDRRTLTTLTLCQTEIPCIVIARDLVPPDELIRVASDHNICVLRTKLLTMKFINLATIKLEAALSDSTIVHGCMVDVRGIGILIKGHSGVGKSETAIGLIERGGCLVADDAVIIHNVGGELITSAPEMARGYIEVRGLGIVNVINLFGLGCVRTEKRLDAVITLKSHQDLNDMDRLGLDRSITQILDVNVPHIQLPVAPGRDCARLVEVAALDLRLKELGIDMAKQFSNLVLKKMNPKI